MMRRSFLTATFTILPRFSLRRATAPSFAASYGSTERLAQSQLPVSTATLDIDFNCFVNAARIRLKRCLANRRNSFSVLVAFVSTNPFFDYSHEAVIAHRHAPHAPWSSTIQGHDYRFSGPRPWGSRLAGNATLGIIIVKEGICPFFFAKHCRTD